MSQEEAFSLWRETLGLSSGADVAVVDRLRTSYRSVRGRAKLLSQKIATDLPDFTVHDMRHLDAVWDLADKLRGGLQFNPLEGYVFGVALLIHDLGMGIAAYPGGMAEVKADTRWSDAVALSGGANAPDGSPARVAAEFNATAAVLRVRHAQHAERLAAVHWDGPTGPEYLIEDSELRAGLGATIGQLAASHGGSTDALLEAFPVDVGAPAGMPSDWTIDALSLGALLRVADAANVDGSRAPAFDQALQQPGEGSSAHWTFQRLLARPYVKNGSLTYTSTRPFDPTESAAWWLAYETLRMVDDECASVDRLLRDHGRGPLAATGVSGAASPRQLAKFVRVEGWVPVDASVYVGDVSALVGSLGGENLYGARPWVALRELLQNASDAVIAHLKLGGLEADEGRIVVGLERSDDCDILTVEDNGVGMSEQVLLRSLLNFGQSFWGTSAMLHEFPGLAAAGFRSTGRYGIGFFSAFMLGERVVVITRRLSGAPDETRVLEFGQGVAGRPVLRLATPAEQLTRPGTRVIVRLADDVGGSARLLWDDYHGTRSLSELCGWLFPASDVDLFVRDAGVQRRLCKGGDWQTISGSELVGRIAGTPLKFVIDQAEELLETEPDSAASKGIEEIGLMRRAAQTHMRPIYDDNQRTVGRAAIIPRAFRLDEAWLGVLCVGGLRAEVLSEKIAGIMLGEPQRASRDAATPLAAPDELGRWATEQAELIGKTSASPETKFDCASVVRALGGDVLSLPVCVSGSGWMTRDDLRRTQFPDEIVLVFGPGLHHDEFGDRGPVELHGHAFGTEFFAEEGVAELRVGVSSRKEHDPMFGHAIGMIESASLGAIVAEAAATSWGCSPDDLFDEEAQHDPDDPIEVGLADGRPFTMIETVVLRKPHR